MRLLYQAVVIGVSSGGFKALHTILPMFGQNLNVPVMVVQHRRCDDDAWLASSLDSKCGFCVKEAIDKEPVEPGVVYLAPSDYHLLVEKGFTLALSGDDPVCFCRPSIDVLFESAADAYGVHLVGVILTGANSDGSNGIAAIKSKGGYTIAQDPESAEVNFMPKAAIRTHAVDTVLPLEQIPAFVQNLLETPHGKQ